MNDVVISVSNVSKCYPVYDNQRARLLHAMWPGHTAGMQEIWALKDIDFEIRRGESVAIIGRNGGGKSTLLQILTGTLTPTTGKVTVNGRVSALLELGSGFNPEYTGRDNVILNGLLLGLSREEILRRFDEIVAFSEIGDALDRPVKTYSSGMLMRLAFSVQILTDPDILIIDEALSVGDFFFQQKCLSYIHRLCKKGVTLLFVSHDMAVVRDLCKQAVLLRNGETAYVGDSSEAIWKYFQEDKQSEQPAVEPQLLSHPTKDVLSDFRKIALWTCDDAAKDSGLSAQIVGVALLDDRGDPTLKTKVGSTLVFQVLFHASQSASYDVTIEIKNRHDQVVTCNGSYTCGIEPIYLKAGKSCLFELRMTCMLEAGQYTFQVSIGTGNPSPNRGYPLEVTPKLGPFALSWDYETEWAPFLGMFGVPLDARYILRD